MVTHHRELLFGVIKDEQLEINELGKIINKIIKEINYRFPGSHIKDYVIMPNHIHLIIKIERTNEDNNIDKIKTNRRKMLVSRIVGYLKMRSAKEINEYRMMPGVPVWQRNYFEHIIKDDEELIKIKKYIRSNPKNWDNDRENEAINPESKKFADDWKL